MLPILLDALDVVAANATLFRAVAFSIFVIFLFHYLYDKVQNAISISRLAKTVPSVEGGLPILGQAINLIQMPPWDLLTSWVGEYGPIFRFHIFGSQVVVMADPVYLKEVMHSKHKHFHKDLVLAYKPFMPLFGKGIVTSDGDQWFHRRKQLSSMLRIDILKEIPDMALRAAKRLCAKLDDAVEKDKTVDIGEELRHLTLHVIGEVLLSISPEECERVFAKVYLPIVTECHKRVWNPLRKFCVFIPAFWKFQRNIYILNSYIGKNVKERWALRLIEDSKTERHYDVLDRILDGFDQEKNFLSNADLNLARDEIKTTVLAGHETSASMLNWTLLELLKVENSDMLTVANAEADSVWTSNDQPDPSALKFAEMCLKEALRKYSIVPLVSRICTADIKINSLEGEEHLIPKGVSVMLLTQGIHHRADLWPNPELYDPTRFENDENIKPYTFLPFLEGPRSCLGKNLSLLESKIVLSFLLKRYKFSIDMGNLEPCKKHKWLIPVIPYSNTKVRVKLR